MAPPSLTAPQHALRPDTSPHDEEPTAVPEAGPSAASPSCFVHGHLDSTLAKAKSRMRRQRTPRAHETAAGDGGSSTEDCQAGTLDGSGDSDDAGDDSDDEGDEAHGLTEQLAATATSVREMAKQLGRARVKASVQSVLIITKARDNHLIKLTRQLAVHLMTKTREPGRDRGITVFVVLQWWLD